MPISWGAASIGAALLFTLPGLGAVAQAETAPKAPATSAKAAVAGEYVVILRDPPQAKGVGRYVAQRVSSLAERYQVNAEDEFSRVFPGFSATMTPGQAAQVGADPAVESVEPNQVFTLNNTQRNAPWGLDRIDQRAGTDGRYRYPTSGEGVEIFVVDTGVRRDHVEFSGRVGRGFNSVPGRGSGGWDDCQGHGTHVASSALGSRYGVAKKARLHAVRVLNCRGNGSTAGIVAGLEWIAANAPLQRSVVNMSLGGGASRAMDRALAALVDGGAVVAVAAGNESMDACNVSPAREPKAITVGASNRRDQLAGFSNVGTCVDVVAPGVNIEGAWLNSRTATTSISGTSMASPHVAGVLALMRAASPDLAPEQLRARLLSDATTGSLSRLRKTPNRLLFLNQTLTADRPPVAQWQVDCEDLTCSVDASESLDDGEIVALRIDFGDGFVATDSKATHSYASAGTYQLRLTVTDDAGATRELTQTVNASAPPCALCTVLRGQLAEPGSVTYLYERGFQWPGGDLTAFLRARPGVDFTLALQRKACGSCGWGSIATSTPTGVDGDEAISRPVRAGLYRFKLRAASGSGDYRAYTALPSCTGCVTAEGALTTGARRSWPSTAGFAWPGGVLEARLRGPVRGDLDLFLQRRDCATCPWTVVDEGVTAGTHEQVRGRRDAGRYRWAVLGFTVVGTAFYELDYAVP